MKKNWLITQAQISNMDIESAILPVDPEQLADAEIFGLAGAVRLRVENAKGPADLFCDPQARNFFRAMHQRWPWAGYFLRLKPITAHSPKEQLQDLSLFMALMLCHVDQLTFVHTTHGTALRYDAEQLAAHLDDLHVRGTQLGEAAGLSPNQIQKRSALISRSIRSFFATGHELHSKSNKNR